MAPRRNANGHGGLMDVGGAELADLVANGHHNSQNTTRCCAPSGECLRGDSPIRLNQLQDAIKVTCNNESCPVGQFMHRECFDAWEQTVLTYLKGCGRARSWSERQRHQNLWTKKGYDLAFKACGCKCGRGHLKKDLDWMPPGLVNAIGHRPDDAEAKKKKRRNRQNTRPSLAVYAGPPGHGISHGVPVNRTTEAQMIESGRGRAGSLSSSTGSSSPPATSEPSVSPLHQPQSMSKKKNKVDFFSDRARQSCGANGIFSRRLDFRAFNSLPRTKLNSYHIKESVALSKSRKVNFAMLKSKPVVKTFAIAYGMMMAQQLSGINVVIFYSVIIFKNANSRLDPLLESVILAVVQVIACILAATLIDKVGRKVLMIISEFVMGLCLFALGGLLMIQANNKKLGDELAVLPLVTTSIYILAFCFGAGPVPWAYLGEIFPPELKGAASSSAAFINWLLAFAVTVPFAAIRSAIGAPGTFWLFSVICFLNVGFCHFCMIETKGKSLEEILRELGVSRIANTDQNTPGTTATTMEDEGNHGNDDTRCFILSTLAALQWSRVSCVLCRATMLVFDRYPLVDGTFFLSPRQHSLSCAEVKVEGRTQFLSAVCMSCLEDSGTPVRCRSCTQPWVGSSLVLGTMYSYDIFAAMPCCTERIKCNSCQKPLLLPHQRLNFYSDYSRVFACPHCRALDAHFVKPLSVCYTREQFQLYSQWP